MMEVCVDPNGHYKSFNVPNERLIAACGVIPEWIMEGYLLGETDMYQAIYDRYGFPMCDMTGGAVNNSDEGIYKYPGDPELHPIVRWESDTQVAFMYEHAIMSFVDKATQVVRVTRVD